MQDLVQLGDFRVVGQVTQVRRCLLSHAVSVVAARQRLFHALFEGLVLEAVRGVAKVGKRQRAPGQVGELWGESALRVDEVHGGFAELVPRLTVVFTASQVFGCAIPKGFPHLQC